MGRPESAPVKEKLSPAERGLLQDFFLSYKFSQSRRYEVQTALLFPLIIDTYRRRGEQLPLTPAVAQAAGRLRRPARHKDSGATYDLQTEFQEDWRNFWV